MRKARVLGISAVLAIGCAPLAGASCMGQVSQPASISTAKRPFNYQDVMVPMRDGVRLETVTFVSQTTGKPMRLTSVAGKLKPEDGPSLLDVGGGTFRSGEAQITFTTADRFSYSTPDGQRTAFVRAARFTPDAAMLAGYVGRYASKEADAVYDVTAEANGLRLTLTSRPRITILMAPAYPGAFLSGDTLLRFRRDAADNVVAMNFGISRVRDLSFTRIPR